MLTPDFLQFLYELSQNNNRDWFEKQKKRFEASVKKPWEATVEAIIAHIQKFDPYIRASAKDCVYRIHRDTRFSTDKSPYKTHMGAVITSIGRKAMAEPGYYVHVEFGQLMLGGGAYFLEKEPLHRVRTAIAQSPSAFRQIIENEEFVAKFKGVQGERNKVLPPEFKAAAQTEPLLANKQFYFMAELPPDHALQPDFPQFAAEYLHAGKALNDFCRAAVRS